MVCEKQPRGEQGALMALGEQKGILAGREGLSGGSVGVKGLCGAGGERSRYRWGQGRL
jgi:hypothetical protein